MLLVFDTLLNFARKIKKAFTYSDTNLQIAKDYTENEIATLLEIEDLSSQIESGTYAYKLRSDTQNSCIRVGHFLVLHAFGNANGAISNAMSLPYVKVPIADSRLLVGGVSINGASYTLVTVGDWSGVKYLKQYLTSNIANGANIDFWAILLVGGGNS